MDNYDYSNITKYLQYIIYKTNRLINCIANWFLKTLCCFVICICFNMIVNNHQIFIPIGHVSLLLIIIYLLLIMIFNNNFEEIFLEYCFTLFGIILGLMYLNNEFILISEKITSRFTLIDLKEKIKFLLFQNHDSYFTSCLIITTILIIMSYIFRKLRVLVRFIIRINTDTNYYDVTNYNTNRINRLFKEREKYLILLNKYIQNDYVYGIGIVGEYGSGKSFIVDEFEKRSKFKYILLELIHFYLMTKVLKSIY